MIYENLYQNMKMNKMLQKITFNIIFLPNVKYPAAVKVGH